MAERRTEQMKTTEVQYSTSRHAERQVIPPRLHSATLGEDHDYLHSDTTQTTYWARTTAIYTVIPPTLHTGEGPRLFTR